MTINKRGILASMSVMLVGALANGVAAGPLEDCDQALRSELRQMCTPQTAEDVLKTTWPGGTNLGAPCYAAADAYYASLVATRSDAEVTNASARFCEYVGLGLNRSE